MSVTMTLEGLDIEVIYWIELLKQIVKTDNHIKIFFYIHPASYKAIRFII